VRKEAKRERVCERRLNIKMEDQRTRSEYLSYSTNEIAGAGLPQIQLTKFKPIQVDGCGRQQLGAERREVALEAELASSTKPANGDYCKSLSADDLLKEIGPNLGDRKWPWSTLGRSVKLDSSFTLNSAPHLEPANAELREPFQIVWRKLAFEVEPSSYDKLIERTSNSLRFLWRLVARNPESNSSFDQSLSDLNSSKDCASLAVGRHRRVIFENLNGYIKSGEISGILGPSGAGKTSLLNAICGLGDNYKGSVQLVGGGKRRMRMSIIPQKDYLMENLTVRENLQYSSMILNSNPDFDHESNIVRVVKMLNLQNCFESSVANISGGEYKRVSIAQELLKQPDILILDEPTSGLDSMNCKNLIKSLRQLIEASREGAINPIAIIMTIHQPDVEVFNMFDHVYCMAKMGRVIFDGCPSECVEHIKKEAGILDEKLELNGDNFRSVSPANLLIEIASGDIYGQEPIELLARVQLKQFEQRSAGFVAPSANHLHYQLTANKSFDSLSSLENGYKSKSLVLFQGKDCSPLGGSETSSNTSKISCGQLVRDKRLISKKSHAGLFWYHTGLLARRAFTSTIRDPLLTMISLVFHLTIPFVMWTVYSQNIGKAKACPILQRDMDIVSLTSNKTMSKLEFMQEEINTALECSTMFFLTTYAFSMCSLCVASLAFPLSMHVLLKEVRNGWYSLSSFVLAKTIANFPFEVIFPVISLVMIYVMLDMPSSYLEWRLWTIALVMALTSMISHTLGLISGALCMNSVQTAVFLAIASSLPMTLLSGFTARIKQMPHLLQKLSWLSLYRYSSDSINIVRFGYGICPCDEKTNEYLSTRAPIFGDVPAQMKPLFTFYLTSMAKEPAATPDANELASSSQTDMVNASLALVNATNQAIKNTIPGVNDDLALTTIERNELLNKIESNEIDLFGRVADLLARSFSYGKEIDNCSAVRSQLLVGGGMPEDTYLPYLLLGMFLLLSVVKLGLFAVVRFKIGSLI